MSLVLGSLSWALGCGGGTPEAEPSTPPSVEEQATAVPRLMDVSQSPSVAPTQEPTTPPVPMPDRSPGVVAGGLHSCGLWDDGRVECWGSNRFQQLGEPEAPSGPGAHRTHRRAVEGITDPRTITAGTWHNCVADGRGQVHCWGHGGFGQLGREAGDDAPSPHRVEGVSEVVALAAGERHTCALRAGGEVFCWGSNEFGQLGDGTTASRARPAPVAGLDQVTALEAGRFHTCVIRGEGQALCWGQNVDGQLADGSRSAPLGYGVQPQPIQFDRPVQWIRAGGSQTCIRPTEGRMRCWGRNDSAQLGSGRGGRPEDVSLSGEELGEQGAEDLAMGARHSCMSREGRVRCVGYNRSGQLGDGSSRLRRRVVDVRGLEGVVDVAAGVHHSCALARDGRAWCWGKNDDGQLGDGTVEGRRRPVEVIAAPEPRAESGPV